MIVVAFVRMRSWEGVIGLGIGTSAMRIAEGGAGLVAV